MVPRTWRESCRYRKRPQKRVCGLGKGNAVTGNPQLKRVRAWEGDCDVVRPGLGRGWGGRGTSLSSACSSVGTGNLGDTHQQVTLKILKLCLD